MNIFLCDDNRNDLQTLHDFIACWTDEKQLEASVNITQYTSSEDMMAAMGKGQSADLLFLDIRIPGEESGLTVADHIRSANPSAAIVFVTQFAEYACAGYRVNALRYLNKPVSYEQVAECLDIAYRQWKCSQSSFSFVVSNGQISKIPHREILYAAISGHYLDIILCSGQTIRTRQALKNALPQLATEGFIQCHRSYIINLQYVRSITRQETIMSDDKRIPIGRGYHDEVYAAVLRYFQGRMR